MPMFDELIFMQVFYFSQYVAELIQRLANHRLANPHRQAHIAEQPGNFGLMTHHEFGFLRRQICQRFPCLFRRTHRMQLFTVADRAPLAVANDKRLLIGLLVGAWGCASWTVVGAGALRGAGPLCARATRRLLPRGQPHWTSAPSTAVGIPSCFHRLSPSTMVPSLPQSGQGVVLSPTSSQPLPCTRPRAWPAIQRAPVVVWSPSSPWPLPRMLIRWLMVRFFLKGWKPEPSTLETALFTGRMVWETSYAKCRFGCRPVITAVANCHPD